MKRRVPMKGTIAVVTATLITMSPLLSPRAAFASTTVSWSPSSATPQTVQQGGTVSIPVSATVAEPGSGPYEYHVSMVQVGGAPVDMSQENVMVQEYGQPNPTTATVTDSVYASFPSTLPTQPDNPFTLEMTPVDAAGSYDVKVGLYDTSSGTPVEVGTDYDVPLTITQSSSQPTQPVTLNWTQRTFQTLDDEVSSTIDLSNISASGPVYYQVQLKKDGSDDAGATIKLDDLSGGGEQAFSLDASGVGTLDKDNGVSIPSEKVLPISTSFWELSGNYTVIFTVFDWATGNPLGSVQKTIDIGLANVSGTVYTPTNTGAQNVTVDFVPSPSNQTVTQDVYVSTNPNGDYWAYLPAGESFSINSVYDNNDYKAYTLQQPITFQSQADSYTLPSITEQSDGTAVASGPGNLGGGSSGGGNGGGGTPGQTTFNFSGTVNVDYRPAANGVLTVQNTSDKTTTQITLDASGNFTKTLPAGSYTVLNLKYNGGTITALAPSDFSSDGTSDVTQQFQTGSLLNLDYTSGQSAQPNQEIPIPVTVSPNLSVTDQVYLAVDAMQGNSTGSGTAIPVTLTADVNGTTYTFSQQGSEYQSQSFKLPSNPQITLHANFPNAGTYMIGIGLVNDSTQVPFEFTGMPLTVGGTSVTGSVYMADASTPLSGAYLDLYNTTTNEETFVMNPTDSTGTFQTQLVDGTWTVKHIYLNNGGSYTFDSNPPTFTLTNGQLDRPITITDPGANLKGTVYTDGNQTIPLASGYILVSTAANAGSTATWQDTWIQTDSSGKFTTSLDPGDYVVVGAYTSDWQYLTMDTPFTVGPSGVKDISVSPPTADFTLTVQDDQGSPINGNIYVLTKADADANNYANTQSLQVKSGSVSGYLPKGDYVVVGISTDTNYWQVHDEFSVDPANGVTSKTVSPPQAGVTGTLKDSQGNPVANATIAVLPTGSDDWSQAVYMFTDSDGTFSDLGWNNGQYGQMLKASQSYSIVAVWTADGNYTEMNQAFQTDANDHASIGDVILPGVDLSGTVNVNGSPLGSGWVAFGPTTIDQTGQKWHWVEVKDGNYQAILASGDYRVYAIEDTTPGKFYDLTGTDESSVTVDSNAGSPTNYDVAYTADLTGSLMQNGSPMANATMMLLPQGVDPNSDDSWSQEKYIPTDANGQFSASLPGGDWTLVGLIDSNGNYSQMKQTVTVPNSNLTINLTPDLTGTIQWTTAPTNAWVILQDTQSHQIFVSQAKADTSGQWSYSFVLPAGNYQMLGISTEDQSGSQNWIDLSSGEQPFSVDTGGVSHNINLSSSFSGTVGGLPNTTGFVVFQRTDQGQTKMVSVPFDASGHLTTLFDGNSGWQVVGIETVGRYYSATGSFSNGAWTVTPNL